MTTEETRDAVKVMEAYANGKKIQYLDNNNKWIDAHNPVFDWYNYDYRIKPEPKYRPFKTQEECWQEMMKHQPFGWIKSKITKQIYCIGVVAEEEMYCFNDFWNYQDAFEQFTFIDGTPFGI